MSELLKEGPVSIDIDACIGCNICVKKCPESVFSAAPVRKQPPLISAPEKCNACGVCVSACPRKVIEIAQ